jgi:O-acetyl-ADP-ribose deacetylase (regulator of RNase III)
LGARTVAFPAISTGIYGWPLDDGAAIALRTVREVTQAAAGEGGQVDEVRFVLFDQTAYEVFEAELDRA